MEGNFERDSTSLIGKLPSTVTTLYHAHNSNVFKSSESSVQITSAVIGQQSPTGGEESSKTSQNFCELDIVSRREKEKSTISTLAETRDSSPKTGVFRKTLSGNEHNKSGVLYLATLVKGVDEDYCKPIITRTREDRPKSPVFIGDSKDPRQKQLDDFFKLRQQEMNNQTVNVKKSRSVSRKRRSKGRSPTTKSIERKQKSSSSEEIGRNQPESSIPESSVTNPINTTLEQVPLKFVDIVQARTMYFVDLPKNSEAAKKKKKNKRPKENATIVFEKQDARLGHIFVNKIEGEYPTMSSLEDTESSIPIKLKPEGSFGSLGTIKRKEKRHDNSPQPEEPSIISKIEKESKTKGKHKKKHKSDFVENVAATQMRQEAINLNCDFVPCKEEKLKDTEKVEVLYKKKSEKKKDSDKKSNKHRSKSPEKIEKAVVKDKSKKEKDKKDEKKSKCAKPECTTSDQIKLNEKPETNSKNLKKKDPYHKSRKSSPLYSKNYDQSNGNIEKSTSRTGSLSNHKKELLEKDKKSKATRKEITKDSKNFSYSHQSRERNKKSNVEQKVQFSELSSSKKFAKESAETLQDNNDIFLSEAYIEEGEINHFPNLLYNNPNLIVIESNDSVTTKTPKKDVNKKRTKSSIDQVKRYAEIEAPKYSNATQFQENTVSVQTSLQPLISTTTQYVGVSSPYMGYFLPPQVAERFSRKNTTPHSVIPERLKPLKKRSKSCVPSKYVTGIEEDFMGPTEKSPFLSSRITSETQLNIPSPNKKRSKSVVTKEEPPSEIDKTTLATIESREHLQQELIKLHMIQQNDFRKRNFKNEPIKGVTGNNRLKPRLPSKEEQEAILKLPIFQNDTVSSTTITSSDISGGIKLNPAFKRLRSRVSVSPEDAPCHPEEGTRFIKKISPRREVSLSQLNVMPSREFYKSPKIEVYNVTSRSEARNISRSTIYSDMMSEQTETENKKLQCVHMILGEKITEICNKVIDNYGNVIEGYIVSAVEPPKKLKYVKIKTVKNTITNKLRAIFFPPTQIINLEIHPKGVFGHPEEVTKELPKSPEQSESTITADSLEKSKKNGNAPKNPIQVKTKKKLIPFESIKKKSKTVRKICDAKLFKKSESFNQIGKSLSNLFLDASSSADKPPHKNIVKAIIEPVKKTQPKTKTVATSRLQDIRSLSRINSAVKMMESSLQIIKEESQSTDSSVQKTEKKEKVSLTDIKQTQTELVISDLERMKEVINFFYEAFDKRKEARKNVVDCLQDPRDIVTNLEIKNDNVSTTETSSCCEQFKNMVKNVKPKFNTLKKLSSKHDVNSSSTKIAEYSPSTSCDTCALISNGSGVLKSKQVSQQKRTFSAEHIRPYQIYQSNSPTRDFLCNLRASKSIHNAAPEKIDKGISTDHKPEIKSSTSISDFSSLIVSLCETEKVKLREEAALYGDDDIPKKMIEEKSIQCTLTDDGNCKSETEELNKNDKENECLNKKVVENKSLQTSAGIPKNVENKKTFCNNVTPKVSSHTFFSHSCPRHHHRRRSCDSLSGSKMSTKYFRNNKDFSKRNNKSVEVDYVNLLRLERHLEQVLGLYPTVCKAIRAHMDQRNPRPKMSQEKCRNKTYYASQDTLATTVDTITEYNVMETDNNNVVTRSSQRYRNMKFPMNKYLYENHFKFPKREGERRNRSRYSLFASSGRSSSRNVEFFEPSTPYPYTDTSSSSSKVEKFMELQHKKDRKPLPPKWNLKGRRHRRSNFNFHNLRSDDIRDNWSIGSPLYSISTPSLSASKNEFMFKTKSKSLTTTQVLTTQLSTSKSLVELSSNKTMNRRAIIQKLKNDLIKGGKGKSFRLGTQQVFVLSLDSVMSSNPSSKLYTRVEQNLQQNYIGEQNNPKMKINETNCYDLLFPGGNINVARGNNIVNRPFYIHNRQSSSSEFDFLDSIEQQRNKKEVEEDMGNFSADSLESACSPADEALNYTMELLHSNLLAPKQNFFVYTSRVNYDSNPLKSQNKMLPRRSSSRNSHKSYSKSSSPKRKSPNRKSEKPDQIHLKIETISSSKPQSSSNDDGSNTLISESGYETSNRAKPAASIKNFFKKGGSLLDIFRNTTKLKNSSPNPITIKEKCSNTNLISFSTLYSKNHENQDVSLASSSQDDDTTTTSNTKILWSTFAKNKQSPKIKTTFLGPIQSSQENTTDKSTTTTVNKKCSARLYEKQMCACHEYAEKVVQESQMKKDGYQKDYKDFEEIPLELLIGRKVPFSYNRKGSPTIIQMNSITSQKSSSNPETPRYPYYESDHILQDMQPFVTFVDDKIVFQSSKTRMRNEKSPTKSVQAKRLNQRGSCHDVCKFRMKKSHNDHDDDDDEGRDSRKRSGDKKVACKKLISIKENSFRRKHSPVLGCHCDDDDYDLPNSSTITTHGIESYKSSPEDGFQTEDDITENQFSDEESVPNQKMTKKNNKNARMDVNCRGIEPFLKIPCFKKKKVAETQIEHGSYRNRGTEPVEEIQKEIEARKRTKETYMDVKPFHKTKGTGPMSKERIKKRRGETQIVDVNDSMHPAKAKRSFSLGRRDKRKYECICDDQDAENILTDQQPIEDSSLHPKTKRLMSLGRRDKKKYDFISDDQHSESKENILKDQHSSLHPKTKRSMSLGRHSRKRHPFKKQSHVIRESRVKSESPSKRNVDGRSSSGSTSPSFEDTSLPQHPKIKHFEKRSQTSHDGKVQASKPNIDQSSNDSIPVEDTVSLPIQPKTKRASSLGRRRIVTPHKKPLKIRGEDSMRTNSHLYSLPTEKGSKNLSTNKNLPLTKTFTPAISSSTAPSTSKEGSSMDNRKTQTPSTFKKVYPRERDDYQSIKSVESEKDLSIKKVNNHPEKVVHRDSSEILQHNVKSKPSRTVHTQIKQDPVLESMYKAAYEAKPHEPNKESDIIELLPPRNIAISDSKLETLTAVESEKIEEKPITSILKSSNYENTQIQEELIQHDTSSIKLAPFPEELKNQEETKPVTHVVDSLTVLHKSYGVAKEESAISLSHEMRPRSVNISTIPVVHVRSDIFPVETLSVHSCASFIDTIMNEIVNNAHDKYLTRIKYVETIEDDITLNDAELLAIGEQQNNFEETQSHHVQDLEDSTAEKQVSEDLHKGLTDKEVFNKLLTSFEKEDEIAVRLSKDETFFHEQIQILRRDSDESLQDQVVEKVDEHDNIYADDLTDKHRSTHFWEEKMKAMRAKEDNPVKTDDIGTCFARGFRPDNIALSGDACFNLNKQDKIKFTKGMLTNEESIIDFSERETPLDYLLALGFMVDEASNALKDDDIRSRLLAAITEARVWINKITTTQGTLLYLVAYKSRPKTMRYFLQLVEAIINKRINNAIKLDGFLRVLEKVEEGEIQMINILGADKFEDEENEEKIVKKQLRQLFVTVYKIAEKEALQKGNELSQQAIVLLRILAAKYRAGLHPHLELIARYIGQDLLNTETQLEAAMIFLSRLDTAEVKLKEFEAYCDIKCEKKKKQTKQSEAIMEDFFESKHTDDNQNQVQQSGPPEDTGMDEIEEDYIPLRRGDKGKKAQIIG
nr:uncharacterized protein LOC111413387 [Onthophagus taurus]